MLSKPKTVLDIGPGAGKYGRMLKDIEQESGEAIIKTCVEISKEKVIERFELDKIYDRIIHEDAARLPKSQPTLTADVAIIGDVIEHLTKSEGIDLLEYLQYRVRHTILVIPVDWISLDYKDYDHEAHISIWQARDFERLSGAYAIERLGRKGNRFVLAVVNAIMLKPNEHMVIHDNVSDGEGLAEGEAGISVSISGT